MYNHAPEHYLCPFCLLMQGIENEHTSAVHTDIVHHTPTVTACIGSRQWPHNHCNVLVVPNAHFENLYDLPLHFASPLHALVRAIALAMKTVYAWEGISTRQHNEPAGQQQWSVAKWCLKCLYTNHQAPRVRYAKSPASIAIAFAVLPRHHCCGPARVFLVLFFQKGAKL